MPSELAQQLRDMVLDVKESMCTQSSARQCEAHRERSQIAQCNDLVCTGCVGLTVGHRLCASVPYARRSKCVFQCLRGTRCNGNIVLNVCVGCLVCVCVYTVHLCLRPYETMPVRRSCRTAGEHGH